MNTKGPMYVVTQKGNVVEEAVGLFDAFIKKFELDGVLKVLESIIAMLLSMVSSYPALVVVKEFMDLVVSKLELFKKYGIV